jgi:hypothetical protein
VTLGAEPLRVDGKHGKEIQADTKLFGLFQSALCGARRDRELQNAVIIWNPLHVSSVNWSKGYMLFWNSSLTGDIWNFVRKSESVRYI